MGQLSELKTTPITTNEIELFVKNYKLGDPVPTEYKDYALKLIDEQIAKMQEIAALFKAAAK